MQENSTNDYTKQKSSKISEQDPYPHNHTHSHNPPSHPISHVQSVPQTPLISAYVQTAF